MLGEARTIDVTAALAGGEGPGIGLFSGQQIAGLMKSDFAEAVPSEPGTHPTYRLTEVGRLAAALIARTRRPPLREEVEQRVAAFRDRRTARLRESGLRLGYKHGGLAGSPSQQAILEALTDGPRNTTELRRVIEDYVTGGRSISLMLRTLKERGAVEDAGMDGQTKVWRLRSQ